jgi:hypothetical protein
MSTQRNEAKHDKAVEDSFPASDPPASSGIIGPRIASHDRPGQTAPHKRNEESRSTVTPADDRHRTEIAHQPAHKERPLRR